jgi:carbon-monoxide dehydrogenase iron sulfur subunit
MAKFKIEVAPGKCTGCLRCELACSELFTGAFNPSAARIRVVMRGSDCDISFTDECTQCCVCVTHCFYDALIATQKENAI